MMETKRLIEAASAIAQATRMRVVESLAAEGPAGLAAGELATLVGTPPNTMSTHLAILARAGVVASDREGKVVRYRLLPDILRAMAEQLTSIADAAVVVTSELSEVVPAA
ncbi:MAG: ArsR/SmtB family transcription factor [Janthinobacterium lividum]